MKQWWDSIHEKYNETKDFKFLTNSNPILAVKNLNIDLIKDKKILEIGVGTGNSTKYYYDKGLEVSALDISDVALERVEQYIIKSYTPDDILPSKYFDIAVSNLVAQHMNDEDLSNQIKQVLESLKDGGVFAMQFAFLPLVSDQSIKQQCYGGCCRTINHMEGLLKSINAKISWLSKPRILKRTPVNFYYIHIERTP